MKLGRHLIEKDQTAPGKNARHQFSEGSAEGFLRRITFRDPLADFLGEGTFEQRAHLCRKPANVIAQEDIADAPFG